MSLIQCRDAHPDDLSRLFVLWQEQHDIQGQLDSRLTKLVPDKDHWRTQIAIILDKMQQQFSETPHDFLVVAVNTEFDSIVGFAYGKIEPSAAQNHGNIVDMVVDAHNGQGGVGTHLLDALAIKFRLHGVVTIQVSVPRYVAVQQAFWRSKGASVVEELMILSLKNE